MSQSEARESVKMFLMSHLNVSDNIVILENIYRCPQYITKSMIGKIQNLPTVKDYKPESVVKYANLVCNSINATKHLDSSKYIKNPFLLDEFISNLTIPLALDVTRYYML